MQRTARAALLEPADEIERLVGGDAAADDQKDIDEDDFVAAGRLSNCCRACSLLQLDGAVRGEPASHRRAQPTPAIVSQRRFAQDDARLVLHRTAVPGRAQAQALLEVIVKPADGETGHGPGPNVPRV